MLDVSYWCLTCGIVQAVVPVRYREAGEDVAAWMKDVVIVELSKDHAQRSPWCRTTTLSSIKIPMPAGTTFIGGQVSH